MILKQTFVNNEEQKQTKNRKKKTRKQEEYCRSSIAQALFSRLIMSYLKIRIIEKLQIY